MDVIAKIAKIVISAINICFVYVVSFFVLEVCGLKWLMLKLMNMNVVILEIAVI
jgi:hypothetical protein